MWTDPHNVGCVWRWYKYFLLNTRNIFISNITLIVVNQKCFKPLFHLIWSSTKIIEFDHAKFPASISSEDVNISFEENFLRLKNSMFSKKWVLQKRKFPYPFFQSISYINVVVVHSKICWAIFLEGCRKVIYGFWVKMSAIMVGRQLKISK